MYVQHRYYMLGEEAFPLNTPNFPPHLSLLTPHFALEASLISQAAPSPICSARAITIPNLDIQ